MLIFTTNGPETILDVAEYHDRSVDLLIDYDYLRVCCNFYFTFWIIYCNSGNYTLCMMGGLLLWIGSSLQMVNFKFISWNCMRWCMMHGSC